MSETRVAGVALKEIGNVELLIQKSNVYRSKYSN